MHRLASPSVYQRFRSYTGIRASVVDRHVAHTNRVRVSRLEVDRSVRAHIWTERLKKHARSERGLP